MIRAYVPFASAYLLRGATLWLGGRLLISVMLWLAGTNPLEPALSVSIPVVGAIVVLGWVDAWRRHERALLGNLGISPHFFSALFALPALLGELGLRLLWAIVS